MWFEVGIEGKDPMDQEEEDWGEILSLGLRTRNLPSNERTIFCCLRMNAHCTLPHSCVGRVMEVLAHVRDKVVKAPGILWS